MKSEAQLLLEKELNITQREWSVLCDYGYADQLFVSSSVQHWQSRMKEAMMEDEMMEMELGESLFNPGDKNTIINVLNR